LPHSDPGDLPEEQWSTGVNLPSIEQEVRRLEALTSPDSRVDAKVRKEAIFG
jgi:hypothetical protein